MTPENSQPQEIDLDRTDVLPVLEGVVFAPDVEDDAVRLDQIATPAVSPVFAKPTTQVDFTRSSAVDLPSLAESLRSVEDRIARQNTEYHVLHRTYEKAQEAEAAAFARASALAAELAAVRAALEAEQSRSRETDRALAEKNASMGSALARVGDLQRQSEKFQSELTALRESVAAGDAKLAQALHSLGERDAQLSALQREHAQVVPQLQARSTSNAQLDAELRDARARADALAGELKAKQETLSTATAQVRSAEAELKSTRRELGSMNTQAQTFLEHLRTREWRLGFDQNLFRELDAQVGAAQSDRDMLRAERDRLSRQVATLEAKAAGREADIANLRRSAELGTSGLGELTQNLRESEAARAELAARVAVLEDERVELNGELAARDRAIAEAKAAGAAEAQRAREALASEAAKQAETEARIASMQRDSAVHIAALEAAAAARDQNIAILGAQLNEARKPLEPVEAEIKRLTDELARKTQALDKSNDESRDLRAALERTRGALEEREFLIRRLERSESSNAAVLGRIQTSIEKLAGPMGPPASASAPAEYSAELIRIDGDQGFSHSLARRTRVGRAASCELQIESSSVSRQHALILMGRREIIIEDLNSTNGVMVNGRKISRQLLNDGDLVMIGEIKFRLAVKQSPNPPEAQLEAPAPG